MGMETRAPEATEEELRLKEEVAKTLESQGVLGKIKAQLRAAVFQAIHGSGNNGRGGGVGTTAPLLRSASLSSMAFKNVMAVLGDDGDAVLQLVHNLLECLALDHTLTVFQAEANVESKVTAWRDPIKLCEQLKVTTADPKTPVLVKLLRRLSEGEDFQSNRELIRSGSEATTNLGGPKVTTAPALRDTETTFSPPVRQCTVSASAREPAVRIDTEDKDAADDKDDEEVVVEEEEAEEQDNRHHQTDDGRHADGNGADTGDGIGGADLEASEADEISSASFEEESIAEEDEEASVSLQQSDDSTVLRGSSVTARASQHDTSEQERAANDEDDECGDVGDTTAHGDDGDDDDPVAASPPPVPATLGPLPSLPGIFPREKENESCTEANTTRHETIEQQEDFDEETEAARLQSLDAELQAMEADDDTGVLQQLKASLQQELQEDANEDGGGDEDEDAEDDNYGSDFEEEVGDDDQEEEEEMQSEMSEDIASVSALSESEDIPVAPVRSTLAVALANDREVDGEDALNSYDYIETVERV